MVNFETVKYFTAEAYEKKRFGSAVSHYQKGSVNVQASLSLLNISQQILLQSCMATALSLAAYGIRQRLQCCVETVGCDSALSDCCRAVDLDVCPGMEMGDFVVCSLSNHPSPTPSSPILLTLSRPNLLRRPY